VELEYDPQVVNYKNLLELFWGNHDYTAKHKRQYMSAIFYYNENQKSDAEASLKAIEAKERRPVATLILPAERFYEAENYHQKYLLRRHPSLVNSLGLNDKQLITSHVAAKLNGFVGGYGSVEQFNAEAKSLGLSNEQTEYIRNAMKSGPTAACSR
jgi:peptide-methionine (S)-S-oxide reductase